MGNDRTCSYEISENCTHFNILDVFWIQKIFEENYRKMTEIFENCAHFNILDKDDLHPRFGQWDSINPIFLEGESILENIVPTNSCQVNSRPEVRSKSDVLLVFT